MAEGRLVVEGDLGVEGADLTRGGEDERVDLDEIGIALEVAAVEPQDRVDDARLRPGVDPGALDEGARVVPSEPVERIDLQPFDRRGVLRGDLFDVDAPLRRDDGEVESRRRGRA